MASPGAKLASCRRRQALSFTHTYPTPYLVITRRACKFACSKWNKRLVIWLLGRSRDQGASITRARRDNKVQRHTRLPLA